MRTINMTRESRIFFQILAILGVVAIANAGVFELPQAHYGHAHAAQPEPFDVSILYYLIFPEIVIMQCNLVKSIYSRTMVLVAISSNLLCRLRLFIV